MTADPSPEDPSPRSRTVLMYIGMSAAKIARGALCAALSMLLSVPGASARGVFLTAPGGQARIPALPWTMPKLSPVPDTAGAPDLSPVLPGMGLPDPAHGLPKPSMTWASPHVPVAAPRAETGVFRAAVGGDPLGPVDQQEVSGGAQAGFFFNHHDAHATYMDELAAFVRGYDEILVESLTTGKALRVFQAVSNGDLTPAQALKLIPERQEPMDAAVLTALYGSGKTVLPEPIFKGKYKAMNAEIRKKLHPRASETLDKGFEAFLHDGDAKASARALRRFNAAMARIHALREKALVEELSSRLGKRPDRRVGVIFGMFHTWAYDQLKKQGFDVERSFHPTEDGGDGGLVPYNRPLRRMRLRRPRPPQVEEDKDSLGLVLFFAFLDKRFRIDKHAARQQAVYTAIADRLKWSDWENLVEDVSLYFNEKLSGEFDERRLSGFMLRWLTRRGYLKKNERRYFRFR